MMIAAKTGLTGLVVIENSARPPLAAAQVHTIATRPASASPGRHASSAAIPPRPARSGSGFGDMADSNTRERAPGLLESARPA